MPVIISTEDIADAQSQNQELQSLLESKISLELCKLCLDNTERTIYCDISGDDVHSYIPSFLKQKIFDVTRCLSHPGVRATKQLITRRFVWPSINKDITHWVKTCFPCQRAKIQRHNHNILEYIKVPNTRFYHVHLDIVSY